MRKNTREVYKNLIEFSVLVCHRIYILVSNVFQSVGRTFGIYLAKASKLEEVCDLFLDLEPKSKFKNKLLRIGNPRDGGYVIPFDLDNVNYVFSPGCDKKWQFEKELLLEFAIPSVIMDEEKKRPRDLPGEIIYIPKFLGLRETESTVTLRQLFKKYSQDKSDLILQMDIEGDEYAILSDLDLIELKNFRIMIIEFHNLGQWRNSQYLRHFVRPLFAKILEEFEVAHLHVNNYGGYWKMNSIKFPRVVEITFIRKDREIILNDRTTNFGKIDHKNYTKFPDFDSEKFYLELRSARPRTH